MGPARESSQTPTPEPQDNLMRARNEALLRAAFVGDEKEVHNLVQAGADVNAVGGRFKKAVLMNAARNGHIGIVRFLLDQPGLNTLNATDSENRSTALMYAAREGHLEIVQALCARGAVINVKNKRGETALSLAAAEGHLEVVRSLLAQGAYPDLRNNKKENAASKAEAKRHNEVVHSLRGAAYHPHPTDIFPEIKRSSNGFPDQPEEINKMQLLKAIQHGNYNQFLDLIAVDTNINFINQHAAALLKSAITGGDIDIISYISYQLDHSQIDTHRTKQVYSVALISAASRGHLEAVKLFLDRGAMVDAVNDGGNTALISLCSNYAAWTSPPPKFLATAQLLLERGANPNLLDNAGETAVDKAQRIHRWNCDQQSNPSLYNNDRHVMMAVRAKSLVDLLTPLTISHDLEEQKSLPPPNRMMGLEDSPEQKVPNETLLHAVSIGDADWVLKLIKDGANVNAVDQADRNTILMHAADKGHLAVVEVLCRHGAVINVKNNAAETALSWAAAAGHMHVVQFLLDHGANRSL